MSPIESKREASKPIDRETSVTLTTDSHHEADKPPANISDTRSIGGSEAWTLFGRKTQRSKVEFFSQVIILYILIICCLVNITLDNGNRELWSTLLGSSIGYLLPSPRLKKLQKQ